MGTKKKPQGVKGEQFFPRSETSEPKAQARYEKEKIAALVSGFSSEKSDDGLPT